MRNEMLPVENMARSSVKVPPTDTAASDMGESLFEQFAWLYIFFREKIFRDDTDLIARVLWPGKEPKTAEQLIEIGCGPGFYACRLASKFPDLSVLGVDRSPRQIKWARHKARRAALENCIFESSNVLALPHAPNSFDVLLSSRLFTVLSDRKRAVQEIFRVVRPGGRCLIAEPRFAFWATLPLFAMRFLAGLQLKNGYREPSTAHVLTDGQLENLFKTQPWRKIQVWRQGRYHYALCEKN